jgi:flagellar protein FliL
MSAAAAASKDAPDAVEAAPAPVGKKKLMMMIAAALVVVLAAGGGGAYYLMKKRAAAAAAAVEEGGEAKEDAQAAEEQIKADLKHAPAFVPLDPFTVNLADREAERYAQVGMTLELTDPKAADLLKAYMPAIRNNILLVLSGKTAPQLMEHHGKLLLAAEVRAAALKPLGWKVRVPEVSASGVVQTLKPTEDEDAAPIRAVHFSNFIIQ